MSFLVTIWKIVQIRQAFVILSCEYKDSLKWTLR